MSIRLFPGVVVAMMMVSMVSCDSRRTETTAEYNDTLGSSVTDTAVYGRCSAGTMMHTLEIVTDEGKTMQFVVDEERGSDVQGGLFAGDRIAVTYTEGADANIAEKVINLTSLIGKWISLDRSFTLCEDGNVESDIKVETNPYTSWTSVNGNIVLNRDTFSVLSLGPDSLTLESDKGIFVYKREVRTKP